MLCYIMKTAYERQKPSILRYYNKNKRELNEYSRLNKYKHYQFNKISRIFLDILL